MAHHAYAVARPSRPAGEPPAGDRAGAPGRQTVRVATDRDPHPVPWTAPTATDPVTATVRLPGSKSMTARALVLSALAARPVARCARRCAPATPS